MAAPLSLMAQVFGVTGLILVPVGAMWVASGILAAAHRQTAWHRDSGAGRGDPRVVHRIAWCPRNEWTLARQSAAGRALDLRGRLGCGLDCKGLRSLPARSVRSLAFYVLVVPAAVAALQTVVLAPAIEFSRNRAIRNSAALIADIEQYRDANGRYPESLMSVHEDYHPGLSRHPGIQVRTERGGLQSVFRARGAAFRHQGVRHVQPSRPARHDQPQAGSSAIDTRATGTRPDARA